MHLFGAGCEPPAASLPWSIAAVPFEQVQTHIVNLPISQMDMFLPG